MEKYEKDGKIAVLVSHGFGAGWSTWAGKEQAEMACMYKPFVEAALEKKWALLEKLVRDTFPDDHFYIGGMEGLEVEWVEKGRAFEIEEYDGSETLHIIGDRSYMVA